MGTKEVLSYCVDVLAKNGIVSTDQDKVDIELVFKAIYKEGLITDSEYSKLLNVS